MTTESICDVLTAKLTALNTLYTSLKNGALETGNSSLRYAANHVNEQRNELCELIHDIGLRWNGSKVFDPQRQGETDGN